MSYWPAAEPGSAQACQWEVVEAASACLGWHYSAARGGISAQHLLLFLLALVGLSAVSCCTCVSGFAAGWLSKHYWERSCEGRLTLEKLEVRLANKLVSAQEQQAHIVGEKPTAKREDPPTAPAGLAREQDGRGQDRVHPICRAPSVARKVATGPGGVIE